MKIIEEIPRKKHSNKAKAAKLQKVSDDSGISEEQRLELISSDHLRKKAAAAAEKFKQRTSLATGLAAITRGIQKKNSFVPPIQIIEPNSRESIRRYSRMYNMALFKRSTVLRQSTI